MEEQEETEVKTNSNEKKIVDSLRRFSKRLTSDMGAIMLCGVVGLMSDDPETKMRAKITLEDIRDQLLDQAKAVQEFLEKELGKLNKGYTETKQ